MFSKFLSLLIRLHFLKYSHEGRGNVFVTSSKHGMLLLPVDSTSSEFTELI